jgi:hypothetical protein
MNNVILLSVVMMNVVMLTVVAPFILGISTLVYLERSIIK